MTVSARTIVAIAILLLAQNAVADDLIDATKPKKIVSAIQDLGYRAKLDVDSEGDPLIHSTVSGTEFAIQFFGCGKKTNKRCTLLLFRVGYDLDEGTTLDVVNSWNEKTLIGRAYLDDESDPWVEWAINMEGQVTTENFKATFDWWEATVTDFENLIDY